MVGRVAPALQIAGMKLTLPEVMNRASRADLLGHVGLCPATALADQHFLDVTRETGCDANSQALFNRLTDTLAFAA